MEELIKRKEELFKPIHQQILMTDNNTDVILLAVNMCESSIKIFLDNYSLEDTKAIINDMLDKSNKVS
jgi:hypothetical protein